MTSETKVAVIGRNLTMLLYDKRISQRELATATGVSEKTISKLVNGLQSVSVDTLASIAEYLDVPVDELLRERMKGGTI